MEVIAIEGPLTDYEVKELVTSALYMELASESQDQTLRRDLLKRKIQLQKDLSTAENRLTRLQTGLAAGAISDETFRAQSGNILQKNQPTFREFSTICSTMRWRNKIESIIWMKQRLTQYFNTNAVNSQERDDIDEFFSAISLWQSKWHVTLTPHEIITLLNLRPVSNAFYELIINGWYDRVSTETAREELTVIVSALPEGPNIYFDQEISDDSKQSQLDNDRQQLSVFQALFDDDEQTRIIEGEIVGESTELDTTRSAQMDKDDDNFGDDE